MFVIVSISALFHFKLIVWRLDTPTFMYIIAMYIGFVSFIENLQHKEDKKALTHVLVLFVKLC